MRQKVCLTLAASLLLSPALSPCSENMTSERVPHCWQKTVLGPKAYVISSRSDRYGANSSLWAAAMLLSYHKGIPLYHVCYPRNCFARWGHTIYHRILIDHCAKGLPPRGSALLNTGFFPAILHSCRKECHSDIPSALNRSGLKEKWFTYFEKEAKEKAWRLKWDPEHALVIHVRLEDCAPFKREDPRSTGKKTGARLFQGYIGDSALQALIKRLHILFPKKEIYLMTSSQDRDLERCRSLVKDWPYVKGVVGDSDLDYTLWQMMCSDILVLSRSTFSMVAGLLHQGSHCFTCENWAHLEDMLGEENQGTWKDLSSFLREE